MREAFVCARCGREHERPPVAYATPDAPASVVHVVDGPRDLVRRSRVEDGRYVLDDERFWVEATLELPIHGSDEAMTFGVWVRIEPDVLEVLERVREMPDLRTYAFEGRLDTIIWPYKNALELPVHLMYESAEALPAARVTDAEHRLGRDQRDGITLARARELAERIEHMDEEFDAIERGEAEFRE